ncbi:MAG: pilus assembly PilX N-terminal domain-containing protein [Pseudomonadota bacterium]
MTTKTITNEDGFALLGSMLFLVVLTIAGIAATNTTSIESSIAGNERVYKQSFYIAEGAAKEAAKQNLESDWVYEPNKNDPPPMIGADEDINAICTQVSALDPGASFGVVDNDIPLGVLGSGHSLKVQGTSPGGRMNFFDLYGQATEGNSSVRIVMGFTKRL